VAEIKPIAGSHSISRIYHFNLYLADSIPYLIHSHGQNQALNVEEYFYQAVQGRIRAVKKE